MPIGDDRAPVQTQAESRKNGRIARREAPDTSGQDTIHRPSITFTVKTCISCSPQVNKLESMRLPAARPPGLLQILTRQRMLGAE